MKCDVARPIMFGLRPFTARIRGFRLTIAVVCFLSPVIIYWSSYDANTAAYWKWRWKRWLDAPASSKSTPFVYKATIRFENVPRYFPQSGNESDGYERLYNQLAYMAAASNGTPNRTTKYILRVGDFNWEDWLEGRERFVVDNCPIKDCWLTSDAGRKQTADALLISQIDGNSVKAYLPKPGHQIWIVRHGESPRHNRVDPSSLRGLLNWTATYRRSSTFFLPYYPAFGPKNRVPARWQFRDPSTASRPPGPDGRFASVNHAAGKTKKVAWFVSNCGAHNGRQAYAAELAKHIDVDIFGACGKMSCTKSECRAILSRDYKFYLAFENSNCAEYITEKLTWQALLADVLPIAMGARPEDYTALSPPHSFVHVDEFRSPRHLAEYLHWLDKNDTAYNEYFHWRDTWTAINDPYWCRLCAALHIADEVVYRSFVPDYTDWWNGACNSRFSDDGQWKTWRPPGFWDRRNSTIRFR